MTIEEFILLNPNWKSKSFKGKFDSIILLPEKILFQFLKKVDFTKVEKDKIKFQFKNSFLVIEEGIISTKNGTFFTFEELKSFKIEKPKGFLRVPMYFTSEGKEVDNLIDHMDFEGEILRTFLSYIDTEVVPSQESDNNYETPSNDKESSSVKTSTVLEQPTESNELVMKDFFKKYHQLVDDEEKIKLCKIITDVEDGEEKEVPWLSKENGWVIISKSNEVSDSIEHIGVQIEWNPEFKISNCLTQETIHLSESKLDELGKYIKHLNNIIPERLESMNTKKEFIFGSIDKNGDGVIDVLNSRNDFKELLKKKQSSIIEINRQYIHDFVKLSNYIVSKGEVLQEIYNRIQLVDSESELNSLIQLLEDGLNSYNLTVVHSLSMVISLTQDDMITFYEIYESFDKSNIFQSNWEREIKKKLEDIDDGIDSVLKGIQSMETSLINEISNLTYITQGSFNELKDSVVTELEGINSSVNFNNLLTGIQTYQMYNINKNTKSLRK